MQLEYSDKVYEAITPIFDVILIQKLDEIHLTPLQNIYQLRPSFAYHMNNTQKKSSFDKTDIWMQQMSKEKKIKRKMKKKKRKQLNQQIMVMIMNLELLRQDLCRFKIYQ